MYKRVIALVVGSAIAVAAVGYITLKATNTIQPISNENHAPANTATSGAQQPNENDHFCYSAELCAVIEYACPEGWEFYSEDTDACSCGCASKEFLSARSQKP